MTTFQKGILIGALLGFLVVPAAWGVIRRSM